MNSMIENNLNSNEPNPLVDETTTLTTKGKDSSEIKTSDKLLAATSPFNN